MNGPSRRGLSALFVALAAAAAVQAAEPGRDAAALYGERCGSCHLAVELPRPAPPAHAVQARYRQAYPERAAFVAAVSDWLAAPDPARALMRGALAHHGPMPPVTLADAEREALAEYLYSATFASPGGQRGACRGDGQGAGAGAVVDGHGRRDGGGRHRDHGAGVGEGGDGRCRHRGGRREQAAAPLARGAALLAPFKRALMSALSGALAEGPISAVAFCRIAAPALADAASGPGVRIGRASDRLRNPDNVPPLWVTPLLAAYLDGSRARDSAVVALDDGGHGYVEPITVQPMCLLCHGDRLAPELAAHLDTLYPSDRARGYAAGDLRGVFWVEFSD